MKTSEKKHKRKLIGGMSHPNRLFLFKKAVLTKCRQSKRKRFFEQYICILKKQLSVTIPFLFPFCCPKGTVSPVKQLFDNRCFFYPSGFHSIAHYVSDNPYCLCLQIEWQLFQRRKAVGVLGSPIGFITGRRASPERNRIGKCRVFENPIMSRKFE